MSASFHRYLYQRANPGPSLQLYAIAWASIDGVAHNARICEPHAAFHQVTRLANTHSARRTCKTGGTDSVRDIDASR